jgi:CspA family cold shock protein
LTPQQEVGKCGRIFEEQVIKSMTGTVKTKTDRGFGFISREGQAKDLFFHSKELKGVTFDELQEGDTVTFDVVDGEKGPAATNVSRA